MATNETGKCINVQATEPRHGHRKDESICPQCGRWLVVLPSGFFRQHAPRFKPGNPKIATELARHAEFAAQPHPAATVR